MKFERFGQVIETTLHSGSCPPGSTGMMTSDCATWFRLNGGEWFRCEEKSQLKAISLFELAKSVEDIEYVFNELKYE